MDAAVRAWLVSQLGPSTDLVDLAARYQRLGNARAVALEVLYERKAALIGQPSSVTVTSVVSVNFTGNIAALERQIALLEEGIPSAPDDPDTDSPTSGPGVIQLVERPRR
ncbi:hypothetical protein [Streptomyces hebeiensis]